MTDDDLLARTLGAALESRRQAGLLRERHVVKTLHGRLVLRGGGTLVDFASNDYLGLRHHPAVLTAAAGVAQAGSGASGLISGHTPLHAAAEAALAAWKQTETAVLLPSGYQANFAAVQALAAAARAAGRPVRFLLDKLSHASLIDAVRATGEPYRVFPHNGLTKLRRLLGERDAGTLDVVCTESVFSMDGDFADLPGLARLKVDHPFALLLDEAHGTGLYGPDGAGLASALGVAGAVDVHVVTLSKAVGVAGGAVCGSTAFGAAVVNFARAYIYSTSVSPLIAAAVIAAIDVIKAEPQRRARVLQSAARLRARLAASGVATLPGDSPIVPVPLAGETAAVTMATRLSERGFLVGAVRPPTVAPGGSRLRITLSCDHTDEELEAFAQALTTALP